MKITTYLLYALTFLTTTQSIICSINKDSTPDQIKAYANKCTMLHKEIEGKNTVSESLKSVLDLLSDKQAAQFFYNLPDTVQEKITLPFIQDLIRKMGDKWYGIFGSAFSNCTVLHHLIKEKNEVSDQLKEFLDLLSGERISNFFYNLPDVVQKTITLEFIKDLIKIKEDIDGSAFSDCTVLHHLIKEKNEVSDQLKEFLDLLSGNRISNFFYYLPDVVQEKITLKFIKDLKDKMGNKWENIHGAAFSKCTVLLDEIKKKDAVSDQLKKFLDLLSGEQIGRFFYNLPDTVQETITLEFIKDLIKIKEDIYGPAFSDCTVLHHLIKEKNEVSDQLKGFLDLLSGEQIADFFYHLPGTVQEKTTGPFIQDLKNKIDIAKFNKMYDYTFLKSSSKFSQEVNDKFKQLKSVARLEAAKWSNRFKSYIANNKKKFFGISAAALGLSALLFTKGGREWMRNYLPKMHSYLPKRMQ